MNPATRAPTAKSRRQIAKRVVPPRECSALGFLAMNWLYTSLIAAPPATAAIANQTTA